MAKKQPGRREGGIERHQLYDADTEANLLGCLILDRGATSRIPDLTAGDFYSTKNQEVFKALQELHRNQQPVDLVILVNHLRTKHKLTDAGGASYVSDLVNSDMVLEHIETYANKVRDYSTKRRLWEILVSGRDKIGKQDTDQLIAEVAGSVFDLATAQRVEGDRIVSDADQLPTFFSELADRQTGRDFTGLDTGFRHLNRVINGLNPELFVYAGMPSTGKTTLLKQLVDNVAELNSVPCIFFSYEQSKEELWVKTLSRLSKVENRDILRGRLNLQNDAWQRVNDAGAKYHKFASMVYVIEGTSKLTVDSIRAISQGILAKHKAERGLIAIDYLQIIPTAEKYNSTKDKISAITSELRRTARALGSPVIAVSSESRAEYGKKGLKVFKESGEIEYSADLLGVMTESGDSTEKDKRLVDLHIVKNRNGERATIRLKFYLKTSNFEEIGKSDYQDEAEP